MSAEQNHIIDKVLLEVNTSSEKTAYQIKNNVDYFLNNVLLLRLEELLDEYDRNDKTFRFDELHLDFFISEWDNKHEIVHEFENSLRKKLVKELKVAQPKEEVTEKNREIPAGQNHENVFIFFLENGFLPWYGKESYISEFTNPDNWQEVIQQKTFRKKLTTLLFQHENALNRFVLQFPSATVTDYLIQLQTDKKGLEKQISSLLSVFPKNLHSQLLQIILQLSVLKENKKIIQSLYSFVTANLEIGNKSEIKQSEKAFLKLKNFVSEYFPEKKEIEAAVQSVLEKYDQNKFIDYPETSSELKKSKQQDERKTDDLFFGKKTDEIIVQNAGLVLLHPFLKTFFSETGIWNKKEYFSAENKTLAVQTLHYIATGTEKFFEANMIFEKYLVGVSLKMPVSRDSMLSEEIKTEVNELLKQVIKHWPALKNTSPDGLREMFLQREGKLIQTENGYKLIVERKTQDILLDKLNWSISIIKLPWSESILFVQW